MHDITEALECFGRLLACLLGTTVLRLDPVYHLVILLHHPSQLTPVPSADVFAPGAEPHSLIFEILFLLLRQVPPVQVELLPPIVIAIFRAYKITEAQTDSVHQRSSLER